MGTFFPFPVLYTKDREVGYRMSFTIAVFNVPGHRRLPWLTPHRPSPGVRYVPVTLLLASKGVRES